MRHLLGLLAGLVILWLLLSGHYSPLILSLGAASCIGTALLCGRMGVVDAESVPLHILARLPGYTLWLGVEIAKSNWDVIQRIVRPGRNFSPTLITLHTRDRSELGQVILANSITLTPGTVTVTLNDGIAEVHSLAVDDAEIEGGEMDQRVYALEGRAPATAEHT